MGRTPDEIKIGLECCKNGIPYRSTCAKGCPYKCECSPSKTCASAMMNDALAYIQQLETKCHQLERERDEMVEIIRNEANFNLIPLQCRCCKNFNGDFTKDACRFCGTQASFGNFEWRGVEEDNT